MPHAGTALATRAPGLRSRRPANTPAAPSSSARDALEPVDFAPLAYLSARGEGLDDVAGGPSDQAVAVARRAQTAAHTITNLSRQTRTLTEMSSSLARIGDLRSARRAAGAV